MNLRASLFFVLFALLGPCTVFAADVKSGMIEDIRYIEKDGVEVVEVQLNAKIIPRIFQLTGEKPRVVCDFPETGYAAKQKMAVRAGGDLIQQIRVGLHYEPVVKTRVVIDLNHAQDHVVDHQFTDDGKTLVVQIARHAATGQQRIEAAPQHNDILPVEKHEKQQVSSVAEDADPPAEKETDTASRTRPTEEAQVSFRGGVDVSEERAGEIGRNEEKDFAEVIDKDIPVLLNVSYERSTNDKEMVLFRLSGFHPPLVFSRESGDLLVVCDFLDAILGYGIEPLLQTDGKYIHQVRVVREKEPDKVRVILDLVGGYNYELKQVFFKEDNLFVIIISSLGKKEE